jgi:hypothetical protein
MNETGRNWPVSTFAAAQRYVRCRGQTGLFTDDLNPTLLTQNGLYTRRQRFRG